MASALAVQDGQLTMSFDARSPDLAPRLRGFLESHWNKGVQIEGLQRFSAGMSWITLGFTANVVDDSLLSETATQQRELILRIGDPGGLLAPYRAEPEFVALTALADEPDLPIPGAVAYSDDYEVLGAPFLITERVQGDAPMPWKGADADRSAADVATLGRDFAAALGAIHAFDWRRSRMGELASEVPLAEIAAHEVQVWAQHADVSSRTTQPQMRYAMHWLLANAPVAERSTIVHGDYRVGNFLQKDGRITAILDWELMHFGDPHEDLAWAGLRTFAGGTKKVGGLIDRDEFHSLYSKRSGFKVVEPRLRYYEVLVQFKMAAMLIGAVRRIESGRARDVRMAAMGFQLAPTLLELNRLIEDAR
jgi:aminoglycoside phosphotransferase (APT) family kinase protein